MRARVWIALIIVAATVVLLGGYRVVDSSAYERGKAHEREAAATRYREQLQEAMVQAEQDWLAANRHVETVVRTETKIREVARDVVREVVVTECRDLGSDWLQRYNAVIAADSENTRQR